jgi:hypothetical protein
MSSYRYPRLLAAIGVIVGVAVTSLAPATAVAGEPGWAIVNAAAHDAQTNQLPVNSTCSNAWDCWEVGLVIPATQHGQPQAFARHWDGSTWSSVSGVQPPGRQSSVLYDVSCATSSDCWGVGAQQAGSRTNEPLVLVEHWNGTGWSVAPAPLISGFLFSVNCLSTTDCWTVGATGNDASGKASRSLAFNWNGTSWLQESLPPSGQSADQLSSVHCVTASDCWAVGAASPSPFQSDLIPDLLYKSQGAEPWVLHWDGSRWSGAVQTDPQSPAGAVLNGVTCVASSDCWAVGSTMNAAGHFSESLAEHWNGEDWSIAADPLADRGTLSNVTCLSTTECWAVGASSSVGQGQQDGSKPQSLIERWDGAAWSVDQSPDISGVSYLGGVACSEGAQCFAAGFSVADPNNFAARSLTEELSLPAASSVGFDTVTADGQVIGAGGAGFYGSMKGHKLAAPMVGATVTPDGAGYWLVAADGGVFSFGDAGFSGSMGGRHLNAPVVGMAATPDGAGYWLAGADGGVFSFGNATFSGSMGGAHLSAPIVGLTPTPDGAGYWLVARDGGVFSFGDAGFFGSMAGSLSHDPATAIASTPDGRGYWLVSRDGGVFAFGDAGFFGSMPGRGVVAHSPIIGIRVSPNGRGYWLVASNGTVSSFGDAA